MAGIYIFDKNVFPELPEIHSSFQLRQALLNSIHIILSKKLNIKKQALLNRMSHRSIAELESLLSAALDFTSPADLDAWEKSNLPHGS